MLAAARVTTPSSLPRSFSERAGRSSASTFRRHLAITRERAAAAGWKISHIQGRLEDLPSLRLDPFDYARAGSPPPAFARQGLAAIRDVLKPGGGAHIMVYGQHGRTATYQLQTLFRLIASPSLGAAERIRIVRDTLSGLPATHWRELARNGEPREVLHDADIFDLYLHSVDRASSEITRGFPAGMRLVRGSCQPVPPACTRQS
jgi:hypothetical protein